MLTDKELSALQNELIDIYSKIEIELILSIAKRLDTYNTVDGVLNWQLKKLSELNVLNKDLLKVIAKYSNKTQKAIESMLKQAMLANLDKEYLNEAFKKGATNITYESIISSSQIKKLLKSNIYDLSEHISLINTKAIESAKEAYVKTLNKAYAEAYSGMYSPQEAIQREIKEMAKNGIKGATYESGRSISIESAVRRDTLSAIINNVNNVSIESCKELGTNCVEVSKHLGARVSDKSKIANHAGWQGKVYQIEGSDKYGNLEEETGYGQIEGLGGVNCRHRVFPYFEGVSKPKQEKIDSKKNKEVYQASQRIRALERQFRDNKRLWYTCKQIGDKDQKKKCEAKAKDILVQIKELEKQYDISSNNRTLILEDLV